MKHDDLVATGRRAYHPDHTVKQKIKTLGSGAFLKYRLPVIKTRGRRLVEDLSNLMAVQPSKWRDGR
jgi:hypothetical protein